MVLPRFVVDSQLSNTRHTSYEILANSVDGYFNATAMCQACGKMLSHYLSNKTTKEFLSALGAVTGFPVTGLLLIIRGENPLGQGIRVDPYVTIILGR